MRPIFRNSYSRLTNGLTIDVVANIVLLDNYCTVLNNLEELACYSSVIHCNTGFSQNAECTACRCLGDCHIVLFVLGQFALDPYECSNGRCLGSGLALNTECLEGVFAALGISHPERNVLET